MTTQLRDYNGRSSNKKLTVNLFNKEIEGLANEINNLIELVTQEKINKRRTENELKQAIANISHDLRTPLTSVLGYIQLLEREEGETSEKEDYLRITKNRTKRLQTLLNEFFELSVVESMDYHLKNEKIILNDVLWEVLMGYYDRFEENQTKADFHIPEEQITILADQSAVKRVVENLLENVIKHSRGDVSISLEQLESSVILTIGNSAGNLKQSELDLLFDRFYTADQTRSGKGTGLGLSIAKSLLFKMNGNLSAELKEGRLYMKCEWKLPSMINKIQKE